ncbi:MAG: hypothetical protein Q7R30_06165 [Acidobacteriota bacterium]|nr:hypothetical protein [Acidobacteriota bacterium]
MNLDRQKSMLIGVAALTALAWGYKLWPSGTPIRPTGPAVTAGTTTGATGTNAPPVTIAAPAGPAPRLSAAELSAWAGLHRNVGRDPFFTVEEIAARNRPAVVARPAPEAPSAPARRPLATRTLTLVMTAGSVKTATIDDQVVRVGDWVGDERVAEILSNAVVLERGGERRRLELAGAKSTSGIILERVR